MSNRRFEMYIYRQIILQMRMGISDRAIAKTGLSGRNKNKWIRSVASQKGWMNLNESLPTDEILATEFCKPKPSNSNISTVEPYRQSVLEWHNQGIRASVIHRVLMHKHNYKGSYCAVSRFIQSNGSPAIKASMPLHFDPAEAAQVDFGKGPIIIDIETGERINAWFFVMTLCFSRHMYVEMVRDQTVMTWLGCHRRAFEFFGGVPRKVIIDNAKCAITKACTREPVVQRSYADSAQGYGFLISPCPPREPQMKGRVESGVKYVKYSFMPLRNFKSLADANQQLREWVLGEAGNRKHGSTYLKPLNSFTDTEKHLLLKLPDVPPELAEWAKVKVHGDCHVQFKKCRYSVPYQHVRQTLWLRASENSIRIYHEHSLVSQHVKLLRPGSRTTIEDHLPPNAQAHLMKDPIWCRAQADAIGEFCKQVIEILFGDKVLDKLRAAQGVVGLSEKYGKARLNAACKRAIAYKSINYTTIKNILQKGYEYETLPEEEAFDLLSTAYTNGRFIRSINETKH
jgi:hypothetical protein